MIIVDATGGKPPGTFSSYSSPLPPDIFPGTSPIGLCIIVHDTHIVNTVCTIQLDVSEQKVSLLFRGLWRSVLCVGDATGPGWLGFRPLHGATLVD